MGMGAGTETAVLGGTVHLRKIEGNLFLGKFHEAETPQPRRVDYESAA